MCQTLLNERQEINGSEQDAGRCQKRRDHVFSGLELKQMKIKILPNSNPNNMLLRTIMCVLLGKRSINNTPGFLPMADYLLEKCPFSNVA